MFSRFISIITALFLTLPMIIIAIFKPKKYESKTRITKYYVCRDCGHSWK